MSVIIVKLPITREISETVHLGPEKVWKGSNKKAVFYSPMSKSVPLEVNEAYEPLQQSFYQSRLLLPHFTLIIINKIAPPPPIRDFNNNTNDCNEEDLH